MRYLLCLLIGLNAVVCGAAESPSPVTDANPRLLVSTQWLQENLDDEGMIVVDVRDVGYLAGHIPGATLLDCNALHTADGLKPLSDVASLLNDAGLRNDATIVVYDDGRSSRGAAGWAFWLLEYFGARDVRVLNGGWERWTAENRPTATQTPSNRPGQFSARVQKALRADRDQVAKASGDSAITLIDARGDAEFNGWPLDGVARGGHIPGALNIDYAWFTTTDGGVPESRQVKERLEMSGVKPNCRSIVYGSHGSRAGWLYFILRLAGYHPSAVYDGGAIQWSASVDLPLDRLPRYQTLVYPQWVKALIDGNTPAGVKGRRFVILESRYTGFSTSQPGKTESGAVHIPGAVVVHPCYFESGTDTSRYYPKYTTPDDGNLLPDDKLQAAVAALGITHDTTVVVYGNGKIIPMTSARVGWALLYAGVEDVRILNGGMTAWKAAGFPVAKTAAPWKAAAAFGTGIPVRSDLLATTNYVRGIVKGDRSGSVLVDVRKKEEYDGNACPYPFFDKKGHIPGAVWNDDYWVLVDKIDDTWRSAAEIRKRWEALGITPNVEPVFYCGTAWRSTVGFFHAWLMGFERIRNYDDSFYGWSFVAANPIALGAQ